MSTIRKYKSTCVLCANIRVHVDSVSACYKWINERVHVYYTRFKEYMCTIRDLKSASVLTYFIYFILFLEICAAGQEILDPDTTCSDCPFDTYQNVTNPFAYTDLCVDCPSNTGTAQRMSSSLSDCMRELLITVFSRASAPCKNWYTVISRASAPL